MSAPTIVSAGRDLRTGALTSVGLTEAMLAGADHLDPLIDRGPLHGIPIGVKDVIGTSGAVARAGSKARDLLGPASDARVVTARRRASADHRQDPYPRVRARGARASAAGVAAGLFLGALGTDTAGSVRMPAAWCGVTGVCPSPGRLPRDGVLALSRSLDRVGVITRTADDAGAISGGLTEAAPARARRSIAGLRIGVERTHYLRPDTTPPDVVARFEDPIETLARLGARLTDVALPHVESITAAT